MAALVPVPDRFAAPLRALAAASDDEFLALIQFLDGQEEVLLPGDLRRRMAKAPSLPEASPDILVVVNALTFPMESERLRRELRTLSEAPELELSEPERPLLFRRLNDLLESPSVRVAAKAANLLTDYDHVYYGARVLTDIRPVFGDDTPDIAAGVVVANLKIDHYGPSGDMTSFHVALDHLDLVELKEVIDRALQKTEASKSFLAEHGLKYLEERQEDGE